jgi:hypothetical protein
MPGEKKLENLLAFLSPELGSQEFVFCSFSGSRYGDHRELEPVASIEEAEGLTLIIPRTRADENRLFYRSTYRRITLGVHSSLDAVGLTAAFAGKLEEHGISVNVVAGFYHDHLFVQSAAAEAAMKALGELSR